ncbi:hypothetical protein BDV96DRAFT_588302 [Lophiotrema nucula]|uniref:Thioesterase-like superfamily-domain-containing protein n=1 Tax=Lophiotrema nucula TaxID=690887 RepID=A0A6A5YLL9_9PLEO|nr:hypothetical protein BDV96DRAFT_588302 [Lophiotrema nucula]
MEPLQQPINFLFSLVSYVWQVLTFLLAIINIKVLPFAWHFRIAYGYFGHYYFHRRPLLSSPASLPMLFQPTVYTTSNPPGECDYNMHKSNSTYLTDLDVARGYHLYTLCRQGFDAYIASTKAENKGLFYPALGGVTCTFKKEIKPWKQYEVWTRVLSWDEKWLYLVSHFVRSGAVKPAVYSDRPWEQTKQRGTPRKSGVRVDDTKAKQEKEKDAGQPNIYATALSKFVFKQGRRSVRPEDFLRVSGLLSTPCEHQGSTNVFTPCEVCDGVDADLDGIIERRRLDGLVVASHMAGLDGASAYFSGHEDIALAWY